MDELRLVRRDEQSLIVATETGEEYRFVVDDTVLAELRALSRRTSSGASVRPREIQSLIREGKTRQEVADITGASEDDIERYEEPVLAERRYILERAQAVPVRTGTGEEGSEQFGAVISERLVTLGADQPVWSSWRDPEAGWMVNLEFSSHGVAYRAVWSFEHRKSVLAPITPDAVNLSKQGDVGDRLIPKLRAVDTPEGSTDFHSTAFDGADADDTAELSSDRRLIPNELVETESIEPVNESDDDEEFARRREIEQRAISTTDEEQDLGQTADLLDALRKRRGAREGALQNPSTPETGVEAEHPSRISPPPSQVPTDDRPGPADVGSVPLDTAGLLDDAHVDTSPKLRPSTETSSTEQSSAVESSAAPDRGDRGTERTGRARRRASIPSWDDILFGTRSDEDPAP